MPLTVKEIKRRYYDKVYRNASTVECACGCGRKIKSKDHYGRDREYISGHNGRKYEDLSQHKREWNHKNRAKRYTYKMKRARQIKRALIKLHGGKCSCCGLSAEVFPLSVFEFEFHHKNPKRKLFNVNTNSICNKRLKDIYAEA